jgi:hypothetical protein
MRHEQDREDLMREATALVERVELAVAGMEGHVTVGFRQDGSASFYFGPDEVYHFNSRQQIRRAYLHGHLLKAVGGVLAQLRRERTPKDVFLLRRDLTLEDTEQIQIRLRQMLSNLFAAQRAQQVSIVAQVPPDGAVLERAAKLEDELLKAEIAERPNVS